MNFDFLPITTKKEARRNAAIKGAVSFTTGVAVGAVIGAAIGLLFAPQSGEETRIQIKDKTTEVAGIVKDKAIVAKDKVVACAGTVKDKVTEKIASIKPATCEEIPEEVVAEAADAE